MSRRAPSKGPSHGALGPGTLTAAKQVPGKRPGPGYFFSW